MSPPTVRATQGNTVSQNQGPQYAKVFIQRDYSDGTAVKFMTNFPQGLENKVRASPNGVIKQNKFDFQPYIMFYFRLSDRCLNILSIS